jgi:hypothetical protein
MAIETFTFHPICHQQLIIVTRKQPTAAVVTSPSLSLLLKSRITTKRNLIQTLTGT